MQAGGDPVTKLRFWKKDDPEVIAKARKACHIRRETITIAY